MSADGWAGLCWLLPMILGAAFWLGVVVGGALEARWWSRRSR